jgi:diguanylate cyclase (GGDEF)-like protein
MIALMLIVTPIYLIFSVINYTNTKDGIIYNSQLAVKQSEISIINTIKNTEKSYEFISSSYDKMMEESLNLFESEYERYNGDVSKIDLQSMKNKYNQYMDFYIINSDGIIIYSTFDTALGIDFKEIPDFYKKLNEIRLGDKMQISKVTSELQTDELRKWGYLPTKDHKYILETGIASQELRKYINKINYIEISNRTREDNPFIKNVVVYDMNYTILGYVKEESDESIRQIIDKVLSTKETYRSYADLDFLDKEYIYVNTFSDALDDSKKVIEITYNYEDIYKQLNDVKKSTTSIFLIYTLISLLVIYILTTKYISNPLIKFTNKIKNISSENLDFKVQVIGNNEIGMLAKSFNDMSEKLQKTLVSKEYFENVIDSVGDIVIILDPSLNILRINKYTRNIFRGRSDKIINKPISVLFDSTFSQIDLMKKLESNHNLEDIENTLITFDNTKTRVISSFSAFYNQENEISGFICNAKDVTKTKEILFELEKSNFNLKKQELILLEKSTTDSLTGIYNRGYIFKVLEEILCSIPVNYYTVSIIMLDIDHFKRVNDEFGHQAGDDVLINIVKIISRNLKNTDYLGRYGGEEFLVILPNTGINGAFEMAERIRKDIENSLFYKNLLKLTISGGIAELNNDDINNIIKRADDLLYDAKKYGRNRIHL